MIRASARCLLIASFLFPLLLLALGRPTGSEAAPAAAAPCAEGDSAISVIFLIDQSGSMGGTVVAGRQYPPSDPTEQRRYAPAYALSRLGEERLLAAEHPISVLGVVGFGKAAAVDLPLTAIAPAPKDFRGWEAERARLVERLKADSRGDTNFHAAFEAAAQQFKDQEQQCAGKTGKKAIILVTDGGPCLAEAGCDATMPYWPQDREQMQRLKQYVRATFDPAEYRLWVLTLTRPDPVDLERVRPDWEELTREYRGDLIALSENKNDVSDRVGAILRELGLGQKRGDTRMSGQVPCGANYVDPYTGFLSLWFLKPSPDTSVSVIMPDGRPLNDADRGKVLMHQSFGPNEEWVVRSPEPGQWRFAGCQEVRIRAESYGVLARFKSPTGVVPLGAPAQLEYSLTDSNGDAVTPLPNYPLQWEASIQGPQGPVAERCQWQQDAGQPGVYACAPLPTGETGQYDVTVSVRTIRADPYNSEPLLVDQDHGASYTVQPLAKPAAVATPPPSATVPPPSTPIKSAGGSDLPAWLVLVLVGVLLVGGLGAVVIFGLPIAFPPPRGGLEFVGPGRETLLQVRFDRMWGSLRLDEAACRKRLPGSGLVFLIVEAAQTVAGKRTVKLFAKGEDGTAVIADLSDGDTVAIDADAVRWVVYHGSCARGTTWDSALQGEPPRA